MFTLHKERNVSNGAMVADWGTLKNRESDQVSISKFCTQTDRGLKNDLPKMFQLGGS